MKKILTIFLLLILSSCSLSPNKDKEIISLSKTIQNQQKEIDDLKKKEELRNKIEKYKALSQKRKEEKLLKEIEFLKSQKANNLQEGQVINFEKENKLDIKFYSQFPLDISTWKKYDEPYQNVKPWIF